MHYWFFLGFLTCIEVVKRPPNGTVGDVCEERRHISSIEATNAIRSKYLPNNVSCLAEKYRVLCSHFGFHFKAGQMLPLALHHELLWYDVYGNSYALGHQWRRASCHQWLQRIVFRIVGDIFPYQFISGYVRLPWYECERSHHEASVQSSQTLSSQNLSEGIVGPSVERLPLLNLQPGADQCGRIDCGADGHGHEDSKRVELAFVQVLPFYDLNVALLLHVSCL